MSQKEKKAEEKLNQAHTIYQNTKEGIFITDLEGKFLSVNKAFEDITEYKESEVIGQKTNILKSGKHSDTFYKNFWEKLVNKGSWEGEIINKTKSGSFIPQWVTINTVYDEFHQPMNYIAVFSDFSKLKKTRKAIKRKRSINVPTIKNGFNGRDATKYCSSMETTSFSYFVICFRLKTKKRI